MHALRHINRWGGGDIFIKDIQFEKNTRNFSSLELNGFLFSYQLKFAYQLNTHF